MFFNSYYPSLLVFTSGIVPDRSAGEDLVQDAFIKLWERSLDFREEAAARAFLYTTVKNSCLNYLEHHRVVQKHAENTRRSVPGDEQIRDLLIEEETHRQVYHAINELPARCRKVLLLSMNGLKNREIAGKLNISDNSVKTQKKIAYKKLKIKLKDIYPATWLLF